MDALTDPQENNANLISTQNSQLQIGDNLNTTIRPQRPETAGQSVDLNRPPTTDMLDPEDPFNPNLDDPTTEPEIPGVQPVLPPGLEPIILPPDDETDVDEDTDGDDEGEGATGSGERPDDIIYPETGDGLIDNDYYEEHKDEFENGDYSAIYNYSNNLVSDDGTSTSVPTYDAHFLKKIIQNYRYYNSDYDLPDDLHQLVNQDLGEIEWNTPLSNGDTPYDAIRGEFNRIMGIEGNDFIPADFRERVFAEQGIDIPASDLLVRYVNSINLNESSGFLKNLMDNQIFSPSRNTPLGTLNHYQEASSIPSAEWASEYKSASMEERWNMYVRANLGNTIAWNTRSSSHIKIRDALQQLSQHFTSYNIHLARQYPSTEPEPEPTPPSRPDLPPERPSIPDPVSPVRPPTPTPEPEPPTPEPEPEPPTPEPHTPDKPIPSSSDFWPELMDDDEIDPGIKDDMEEMMLDDRIEIRKKTIEEGRVEYNLTETYKNKRLTIFDVGQLASKEEIQNFWKQTITQAGLLISSGAGLFTNILSWVGLGNDIKNHSNIVNRSASLLISHSQGYNWLGPELSFGKPKNILDCISAIHDAEYMLSGSFTHDADMDFINRCSALQNGLLTARYIDEDTNEVQDYLPRTNTSMIDLQMIDIAKRLIEQKDHIQYSDSKVYKLLGLSKADQEKSQTNERDFLLQQLNKSRQELHDIKEADEEEQYRYFKLKEEKTQSDNMRLAYQKIILSILRNEPIQFRKQRIQSVINYLHNHSKSFSHSHQREDGIKLLSY